MYDHMIEEMADAIAKELHLEPNAILPSLHRFWQDKIAHVWQVEDIYESARRVGKAVTREDAIGLLQDALATQFFGLMALTKTLAAFVAGYFFNENLTEQTLSSYRFLLIIALSSLVHNGLFYAVFLQGIQDAVVSTTIEFSLATSLYTAVVGVFPMFAFVRKFRYARSL